MVTQPEFESVQLGVVYDMTTAVKTHRVVFVAPPAKGLIATARPNGDVVGYMSTARADVVELQRRSDLDSTIDLSRWAPGWPRPAAQSAL